MNRYEMIDPKGNMKGWVHARCEYDARESFYKSRHYKPIPKGWTVKEIAAPTDLKVGTRVKRINMENGPEVPEGSIGIIYPEGTKYDTGREGEVYKGYELAMESSAPEVACDQRDQRIVDLNAEVGLLKSEKDALKNKLTVTEGWLADANKENIDLLQERNHFKQCSESAEFREKAEQRRANAAEAKLSDIAAINRVATMITEGISSEAEDWTFPGLIAAVLRG